jgi:hypothetical protein
VRIWNRYVDEYERRNGIQAQGQFPVDKTVTPTSTPSPGEQGSVHGQEQINSNILDTRAEEEYYDNDDETDLWEEDFAEEVEAIHEIINANSLTSVSGERIDVEAGQTQQPSGNMNIAPGPEQVAGNLAGLEESSAKKGESAGQVDSNINSGEISGKTAVAMELDEEEAFLRLDEGEEEGDFLHSEDETEILSDNDDNEREKTGKEQTTVSRVNAPEQSSISAITIEQQTAASVENTGQIETTTSGENAVQVQIVTSEEMTSSAIGKEQEQQNQQVRFSQGFWTLFV